jgi:hypothetical protein
MQEQSSSISTVGGDKMDEQTTETGVDTKNDRLLQSGFEIYRSELNRMIKQMRKTK